MARGPRLSPIEILLDIFCRECESRWASIDDTPDGGSMALAERGDGKDSAECITGHMEARSLLDQIQLDAQFLELISSDSRWCIGQWALRPLRLGERDDVAD